jgi:CRP-like cAMP-binding protein
MHDFLKTYLRSKTGLNDEKLDKWVSLFTPLSILKNDYILREGEICRNVTFVCKGCLRLYSIDSKGKEHIMQFAPEEWWIGDTESFSGNTPSQYFIDALEDSEVLQMDMNTQTRLMQEIPEATMFFQHLMQKRQAVTQRRIAHSMSASAEERYLDFMKTYPSFSQRIPQHMIASYLGITPESLSRIRKSVVGKK